MSTVLLGAPGGAMKENAVTTWETNKIGGWPDWLQMDMQILFCVLCQKEMMLVTQIYCPLSNSPYHRCLHLFVCPSKLCSAQNKGWRAVRTQQLDTTFCEGNGNSCSKNQINSDEIDWGVSEHDWLQNQHDWEDIKDQGNESTCQSQNDCSIGGSHCEQASGLTENVAAVSSQRSMAGTKDQSRPTVSSDAVPDPLFLVSGLDREEKIIMASPKHCSTECDNTSITDRTECDVVEEVEAEAIGIDGQSLQRMMALLAVENFKKSPQSVACEEQRRAFPAYYLEVFAESELEVDSWDHVMSLLQEYEQREGRMEAVQVEESRRLQSNGEKYQATEVKHGDKLCYKFIKRLQIYPQQCIRYQWNGSPLLLSQLSAVDRCEHCTAARVFELQLVPPLVPLLKLPGQPDSLVEFGTVLVFTCTQSCWSERDIWHEEFILLQHDPDEHRFKELCELIV